MGGVKIKIKVHLSLAGAGVEAELVNKLATSYNLITKDQQICFDRATMLLSCV